MSVVMLKLRSLHGGTAKDTEITSGQNGHSKISPQSNHTEGISIRDIRVVAARQQ